MSASALVTGATGFVGSHLVRHLLDLGWQVCATVRPTSPVDRLPQGHPALRVCAVDGTAGEFRRTLLSAEVDTVFHLAAQFVSEHDADDIDALVAANVGFGTHLLQGMVEAEVERVVVASTVWRSHGELDDQPVNLYAATKAALDPILGYYTAAHGISAVVLELGDNYGPDDPRGKVVSALIRAAQEGRALRMSPGDQALDLVHVDDVVRAFAIAAGRFGQERRARLERFNVLSEQPVALRELAAEIGQLVGRELDVAWGARDHRPRQVMWPAAQSSRLPGWEPVVPRHDGLRELIT